MSWNVLKNIISTSIYTGSAVNEMWVLHCWQKSRLSHIHFKNIISLLWLKLIIQIAYELWKHFNMKQILFKKFQFKCVSLLQTKYLNTECNALEEWWKAFAFKQIQFCLLNHILYIVTPHASPHNLIYSKRIL